ncbi:hypothetical protein Rhopal_001484-T1 [Rhodotorula paludigena]|uniref:Beta-mannosidase B n=1 Tax=Rhodotorula paludigena TaxID=86838 RepID=A0AAV5GDZ6_9BASI|nr:hypothetical protein Rhopal_001484-T1 [Rhodotorula paludigena]
MRTLDLTDRSLWSWRQSPPTSGSSDEAVIPHLEGGWRPCSQFPSLVQAELQQAGLIPDFALKRNEELVQWVGEAEWLYRCEFELDQLPRGGETADLVFDGLDTFATVFLNGKKVLEADNMFLAHRVPATKWLQRGANTIYIAFHSAFRRARQLEEEALGRGKHWPAWNGDKSRLFVRKGGWNWSWDWGPCLMTAGPFRPVRLEVFNWPRASVSENLDATLSLRWDIVDAPANCSVTARLLSPGGSVFSRVSVSADEVAEHVWYFEPDEIELWWTAGLGAQPLFEVQVDLVDMKTGAVLDSVSRKVGFRRLRIVREPLANEPGSTFLFELNNAPLFCGGSNWIPIDSISTNAGPERYRRWLELARDGNQNMIRVWGGGMYEEEVFYETCDELGLLVWQDFMFACGAYPAHLDAFRGNVTKEATQAVKRLRSHACLALFAGNNEDYQIAEAEGLEYDPQDSDGDWLRTNFPARELYERVLPSLVGELSDTFYWPGSPWGGETTRDQTEGDVHVWDVWHGTQEPYQEYERLGGRFVSEFASGFERRLALYISENIRSGPSLEDYIYSTQFIQAEAMSSAFSGWRRRFTGGISGAACAGALVWQLNDVWPTTSWAVCDYFLRPKPAYFVIKRALAPIAVVARRYTVKEYRDRFSVVDVVEIAYVDVWASSSGLSGEKVVVRLAAYEILTGKRVHQEEWTTELEANRSTELKKLEIPLAWNDNKEAVVVHASLHTTKSGSMLSSVAVWPEPFKYLTFPKPKDVKLDVRLVRHKNRISKATVFLSSSHPLKGLVLDFAYDVKLSDNFLDLMPGETREIDVAGLPSDNEYKLTWRYLGDAQTP